MKLSIIMPVYNEIATVAEIVRWVARVQIEKELIIVDDGSTDGTRELLAKQFGENTASQALLDLQDSYLSRIKLLFQKQNLGKGAAIQAALSEVRGEIVIIQDADLEYDPEDYARLIQPILEGKADVVYGSRFIGTPRRILYFWHTLGNRVLTLISNIFADLNLTDMETGYKAFRADVLKSIRLRSKRFGFEPEITAKVARRGCRIYEVPVSYYGRTYEEGKKINWRDGIAAVWSIVRFACVDDLDNSDAAYKTLQRMKRLKRYNTWVMRKITPFVGQRVLEVGSGVGNNTSFLLKKERLIASDVDPVYLQHLKNRFDHLPNLSVAYIDLNNLRSYDLEKEKIDTILCLNVLEHICDDCEVLKELHSILTTGGRLILMVPALKVLYGSIDKAIHHYRRYSKQELENKLATAGFEVEHLRHLNIPGAIGWFFNSRVARRGSVPGFQAWLNDLLVPLLNLEDLFHAPFGLSLLAIGRKREKKSAATVICGASSNAARPRSS